MKRRNGGGQKSWDESAVAGKVNPQPLGVAPVVRRWFVRSSPRAMCRGLVAVGKDGFYGGVAGLGGVASEPLRLRVAGKRRGPAYWALWLPWRAA